MNEPLKDEYNGWKRETIEEHAGELSTGNTSNFIIYKTKTYTVHNRECHSPLSDNSGVVMVLTKINDGCAERYEQFYKWLVNDSPVCGPIMVKDWDWVAKNGILIDTTEVSGPHMQFINILMRAPWEHPHMLKSWKTWVKGGMDPCDAAVWMHVVSTRGEKTVWFPKSGHTAFEGLYCANAVRNFKEGKFQVTGNDEPYHKTGRYNGVYKLFGGDLIKSETITTVLLQARELKKNVGVEAVVWGGVFPEKSVGGFLTYAPIRYGGGRGDKFECLTEEFIEHMDKIKEVI